MQLALLSQNRLLDVVVLIGVFFFVVSSWVSAAASSQAVEDLETHVVWWFETYHRDFRVGESVRRAAARTTQGTYTMSFSISPRISFTKHVHVHSSTGEHKQRRAR